MIDVPKYPEISVKNIYQDAMADPELANYLPTMGQLSNKSPERDFFFGVLCTKREAYMRDIIKTAYEQRFKADEEEEKKDSILLSETWLEELKRHPYYSSKSLYSCL